MIKQIGKILSGEFSTVHSVRCALYVCSKDLNEKCKLFKEEKAALSDQGLLTLPFIPEQNFSLEYHQCYTVSHR